MYRLLRLFCIGYLAVVPVRAQPAPAVIDVEPAAQALAVDAQASITIRFDRALDPASISSQTVRVFGRWSGPAKGAVVAGGDGQTVTFIPEEPFFAGETVTVSVARGVMHAGVPMETGYAWSYWIATAPGTLDLREQQRIAVRRPGEGFIQVYGTYGGDLNDDGWSDLIAINEQADDVRVFLNDGTGRYGAFTTFALPGEMFPSPNEGADFDGDGYLDLAVAGAHSNFVSVLMGDGEGGFRPAVQYAVAPTARGLGVLDLDGDGDDDLVTTNRQSSTVSLLMNEGDGTFAPARTMDGGGGQESAIAVADADGDGVQDVFIGAYESGEILLLRGNGQGGLVFSDRVAVPGRPWMMAAGDLDGDGYADAASVNSSGNVATVVFGDGQGGMSDPLVLPTGRFPLAIDLGDLDGDGDLDLITSNFGSADWTIYENTGGSFDNRRTLPSSRAGSCATLHDRDNDGDLDLTGADEVDDLLFLYENPGVDTTTERPGAREGRSLAVYPNPAGASVVLSYELERAALVTIGMFDLLGREITQFAEGRREAGRHEVVFETGALAGGVYLVQLKVDGRTVALQRLIKP